MQGARFDLKLTFAKLLEGLRYPVYKVGEMEVTYYFEKAEIVAGKHSYGRINVYAYQIGGRIEIGKYTSISEIDLMLGGDHHRNISTFPFESRILGKGPHRDNLPIKGITIGNDCWIGLGSTILDGVTLGDGCIVAAGSVVTKSFDPYSIVGGVPAKLIRKRYSEGEIQQLLELKWWEFPTERILENLDSFYGDDIGKLSELLGKEA